MTIFYFILLYLKMHHITLNLPQLLLLIGFIYIFTFYWLPKEEKTDEYLKLLDKYNKVSNQLEKKIKKSIKNAELNGITMGKSTSAHNSSIKPVNMYQNDNNLVQAMTS